MTFVSVLLRNIMRLVDALPSAYAVGVIAILFSKKHQRLGDMAAGTLVIKELTWGVPQTIEYQEKEFPWSGKIKLRIHGIKEDEFAILKSFLLRRFTLEKEAAQEVTERLTLLFSDKLGVNSQEINDRQEFLEQVAAAYLRK